ncbi:MAG TPA: DegT/DnrJ/EryC1/StrS family aminotransferase [Saprospiraceae bacterium]|nr:DegT/DnrJ/EryC1/StrS family aminotransferase [Saprospiraceae bacterium]
MKDIQMVDLQSQYSQLKSEIDSRILSTIESAAFIHGPEVKTFEAGLSKYLDDAHIIACANGTDALQIALMALELQAGDEVIVPSFTFVASVEVIALLGLKPIVVDVDDRTFLMKLENIVDSLSPRTRAIIPVHLFGQCVNMKALTALAKTRDLFIIEDNAQSIGARCLMDENDWRMSGTIGDIGCTSFYPSKNLGCYGDGGAMMTKDEPLAHKMKMVANHGMQKRYYHDIIGVNSRLDSLQAAVLNAKLPHLDEYNKLRRGVADQYDKILGPIGDIIIPQRVPWSEHVFHQYTIRVHRDVRNELQAYLAEQKIPSMIYYPVPMHEQPAFNKIVRKRVPLHNTERISREVLSLPMHPDLTEEQIGFICDGIKAFFKV